MRGGFGISNGKNAVKVTECIVPPPARKVAKLAGVNR